MWVNTQSKRYILIKSCDRTVHTQAWYANKIGYGFVYEYIERGDFILKIPRTKGTKIGLVSVYDAEIFTPTFIQKIKIKFGIKLILTQKQIRLKKLKKLNRWRGVKQLFLKNNCQNTSKFF